MLRPEQETQWQYRNFFNPMRDWHKVFISPDPWSEFIQLERHRPATLNYDGNDEFLLLRKFALRALLASILNDFTLPEIWDLVMKAGRDRSSSRFNYLSAAATYNNTTFTKSCCDPEATHKAESLYLDFGDTIGQALVVASIRDNTESYAKLLDIPQTDALNGMFSQMALIISSRAGNLEVVRMLLAKGSTPEYRAWNDFDFDLTPYKTIAQRFPSRNFTALMAAAMGDHAEAVELLLQLGAPKDSVDKYDKTALMYAKSETVRRLLASDSSGTAVRPGSPSRSFHSRYSDSDIEH
jgi:hypothetical protein